ncbi:MAG: hypothetical protein ACOCXH_09610 [Cyclobacteriaceae bacterium]
MVLGEVVIALLTTLFVSLFFLIIFGYKGKWGNFWIFYLIVFGITLFSTLLVGPSNNNYEIAAWLPVFFISLISAGTLASITIPLQKSKKWNTYRSEMTTIVADRKMIIYSAILMTTLLIIIFSTIL